MLMRFRLKLLLLCLCVTAVYFILIFVQPEIDVNISQNDIGNSEKVLDANSNNLTGEDQSRASQYLSRYSLRWQATTHPGNAWKLAKNWVTTSAVHPDYAPELGMILSTMSKVNITKADVGIKGTQLKMSLTLDGDQLVAFKPKWFVREYIVPGEPYDGADRHNGEIAAYHLNRILGYNKSPLVVGRVVNLLTEILPVATKELKDTFYEQDGNTCFYGKCYYCKQGAGVCGEGAFLEGSLVLWLPNGWTFKKWPSPWRRTYIPGKLARWQEDDTYCSYVEQAWPYSDGHRLVDLLDAVILDYLIGNADRHHYETFSHDNNSMIILMDNAKSFGNPYSDEASILAPLRQCCRIRESTYLRLRDLQGGVVSVVLKEILSHDPISPVLNNAHYIAIDRRLQHLLLLFRNCYTTGRLKVDHS